MILIWTSVPCNVPVLVPVSVPAFPNESLCHLSLAFCQSCANSVPILCQSCANPVPILCQSCANPVPILANPVPILCQSCAYPVRILCQSCGNSVPILCLSCAYLVPILYLSCTYPVPITVPVPAPVPVSAFLMNPCTSSPCAIPNSFSSFLLPMWLFFYNLLQFATYLISCIWKIFKHCHSLGPDSSQMR